VTEKDFDAVCSRRGRSKEKVDIGISLKFAVSTSITVAALPPMFAPDAQSTSARLRGQPRQSRRRDYSEMHRQPFIEGDGDSN
jgi:hypothetical protein